MSKLSGQIICRNFSKQTVKLFITLQIIFQGRIFLEQTIRSQFSAPISCVDAGGFSSHLRPDSCWFPHPHSVLPASRPLIDQEMSNYTLLSSDAVQISSIVPVKLLIAKGSSSESPLYSVILSPNILQAQNSLQSFRIFHDLDTFEITSVIL